MANNSKQYGLIMPQKANQGLVRPRPSVFNESSGSEEEGGGPTDWVKKALKRGSEKSFQKKQHEAEMEKVLAEDPTVYQYDEVYDKMEEKKAELVIAKKQEKKPRYIQSLMLQAEKRKRELERRNERIIQKEREAEGDKFKDKESFVTSAYRAKLEEFRQQEEEEKRMDVIEALTDVTKQKDLGGFYRHLYRQTVSGESAGVSVKQEKEDTNCNSDQLPESKDEEMSNERTEKSDPKHDNSPPKNVSSKDDVENSEKKNSRHYRRRNDSSASSNDSESKHSEGNLDGDSDFSIDSDSSKSESNCDGQNDEKKKRGRKNKKENSSKVVDNKECTPPEEKKTQSEKRSNEESQGNPGKKVKDGEGNESTTGISAESNILVKKEVKEKPNIWVKRTVGEVFESALQRYYERKANRVANRGLE